MRYKDSALGFLWTLLNPLLYLVVFSVVFGTILREQRAPVRSTAPVRVCSPTTCSRWGLGAATTSITGNGPLVQKVWFPREILPLASIGANLITFFFQLVDPRASASQRSGNRRSGACLWLVVPGRRSSPS